MSPMVYTKKLQSGGVELTSWRDMRYVLILIWSEDLALLRLLSLKDPDTSDEDIVLTSSVARIPGSMNSIPENTDAA